MCFSASASFFTAGLTGLIGLASLAKAQSRREWPLAAMPILFAAQQAVEGLIWVSLPVAPEGMSLSLLTFAFVVQAKVVWPAYAPMAALLIEPDKKRRELMYFALAAGLLASAYFLHSILASLPDATIQGGHIVYSSDGPPPFGVGLMYMLAISTPLALSSHMAVRLLAGIVTIGASITFIFYWESFASVWCFFAAAASMVILLHFAHEAKLRTSFE